MSTTVPASLSLVLPDANTTELPPQLIFALTILTHVVIGTLGAIVWDIVSNVGEDYQLVSEFPIGIPTAVYFISRIATLAFFILISIFSTSKTDACHARVLSASAWVFVVAMPATTLLFFFRVRAVYMNNTYVTVFFFFVWLVIVAGCFVVASQTDITHSNQSNTRCMLDGTVGLVSFVTAVTIVPMVNDVLIFCAVTWKLMQNTHVKITLKKSMKIILFGHYLPAFSKTLLRDGQAYFLSTVILAILTTATLYSNSKVGEYSIMLAFPNVAIMNSMACRIYRKTKLHMHWQISVEESVPSLEPIEFRVGFAEGSGQINSRVILTGNSEISTVGGVERGE